MTDAWFAVCTQPSGEFALVEALAAAGCPACAPYWSRRLRAGRNRHHVTRRFPIFRGLVLSPVVPDADIPGWPRVHGVLGLDGRPREIPARAVAEVLRRQEAGEWSWRRWQRACGTPDLDLDAVQADLRAVLGIESVETVPVPPTPATISSAARRSRPTSASASPPTGR